jgi:hypothetical protein
VIQSALLPLRSEHATVKCTERRGGDASTRIGKIPKEKRSGHLFREFLYSPIMMLSCGLRGLGPDQYIILCETNFRSKRRYLASQLELTPNHSQRRSMPKHA